MNRKDFEEKLLPFFTVKEIAKLEKMQMEKFFNEHNRYPDEEEKSSIYEICCNWMFYISEKELNDSLAIIIGRPLTPEQRERLEWQFDNEW